MSSMQGLLNVAVYAGGHKTLHRCLQQALLPTVARGNKDGGVSAPLLSSPAHSSHRPRWMPPPPAPTPINDNTSTNISNYYNDVIDNKSEDHNSTSSLETDKDRDKEQEDEECGGQYSKRKDNGAHKDQFSRLGTAEKAVRFAAE